MSRMTFRTWTLGNKPIGALIVGGREVLRLTGKETAQGERIAAAWNACEGIPTDQLAEVGLVGAVSTYAASMSALLPFARSRLEDIHEAQGEQSTAWIAGNLAVDTAERLLGG